MHTRHLPKAEMSPLLFLSPHTIGDKAGKLEVASRMHEKCQNTRYFESVQVGTDACKSQDTGCYD